MVKKYKKNYAIIQKLLTLDIICLNGLVKTKNIKKHQYEGRSPQFLLIGT